MRLAELARGISQVISIRAARQAREVGRHGIKSLAISPIAAISVIKNWVSSLRCHKKTLFMEKNKNKIKTRDHSYDARSGAFNENHIKKGVHGAWSFVRGIRGGKVSFIALPKETKILKCNINTRDSDPSPPQSASTETTPRYDPHYQASKSLCPAVGRSRMRTSPARPALPRPARHSSPGVLGSCGSLRLFTQHCTCLLPIRL